MKNTLLVCSTFTAVFLLSLLRLQAQSGLLVSDERYQTVPLLPTYSGQKFNEIPLKVSLKKYAPVPGNQQNVSSCVGWATGYGALTIMAARQMGLTDQALITERAFSAAFIYNQVARQSGDCDAGAYVEDALKLLLDLGDCFELNFNFTRDGCKKKPVDKHYQEALSHRIADFASVFELGEPGKSKIAKACKVLATETPLIVGLGITPDFWDIKPGTALWDPDDGAAPQSFHAMVLVGYDNVERRFELMNSFGPGWGRSGFIQIRYDDFERLCRYAWVMIPGEGLMNQPPPGVAKTVGGDPDQVLQGAFVFRTPAGYLQTPEGLDIPYFEEVTTRYLPEAGHYVTDRPAFALGDAFQLVAREIPRGHYAYVFSQSPNGRVNLHFPKGTASGLQTAGFVLEQTAEIVIPAEMSLLQLSEPGTDWLCVLYSAMPVPEINIRMAQIEQGTGTFPERVRNVFSDVLIRADRVQFEPRKMAFSALSDEQHGAAVLLLRVVAE